MAGWVRWGLSSPTSLRPAPPERAVRPAFTVAKDQALGASPSTRAERADDPADEQADAR
jgi:hypothetical protein